MKKLQQFKPLKSGQTLQDIVDFFKNKDIPLKNVSVYMNSWNILELEYYVEVSNKGNILKNE